MFNQSIKSTTVLLLTLLLTASLFSQKVPLTTKSDKAREAYIKGREFNELSDPQNAQTYYEKAVKLDPHFLMARFNHLFFLTRVERPAEIKKMSEMLKTAHISEGERLFLEGSFARFSGDRKTTRENNLKLAKLFPNDERIVYTSAFPFYFQGDYKTAIEKFEKVIHLNPNYVPVYNMIGYCYKDVGNMEKADWAFKKSIELAPKNANGYDSYGEFLMKQGRFDESIKSYEQALKTNPLFPSAVMGIASNLMHKKDYTSARTRLMNAMKIAPNDVVKGGICWAIATTYMDQGDYEKGLVELKKNYEYSKKQANNEFSISGDLQTIASILLEKGELDAAEAKQNESISIITHSKSAQITAQNKENTKMFALYGSSKIAIAKGNLHKSIEDNNRFMEWATKNQFNGAIQQSHEIAGLIAFEKKEYKKAIEEFGKANKGDAYNMYRIALAQKELGNHTEAKKMFTYVTEYRGNLNMNYSLVRHKAAKELHAIASL